MAGNFCSIKNKDAAQRSDCAGNRRKIRDALRKDPHASRVTRALRDVSYATAWRVADRASIELTAGRDAKGYKRFSAERWAEVERAVLRHPNLTQEQLARKIGVCRSTVGRVVRARRAALVAAQ
jgi:hypothetical protein